MRGFGGYPDDAYGDVVEDVLAEWTKAAERARSLGVPQNAFVFDPGLGFDKNGRHSQTLLAHTNELVRRAGAPVLIGASRKSFLAVDPAVDPGASVEQKDIPPPSERIGASLGAAVHSALAGAAAVRVHDVRATIQAVALIQRLRATSAPRTGGMAA
jgi:dihydropteroate synthase